MAGTWTCSEDEDFGSIGDLKVIITGGTSGTPATFADFVTADRAGESVLLAATACTTNMTLTEQIRPVEDLALQISFVLSGTSAGAGDTLDITGTDWDAQAQSESIDVSGGDGTYNGSYKWRTITNIDCTGWADGTLKVTQPRWGLIWDHEYGQYRINGTLDIGDGSTSTYLASTDEDLQFPDDTFSIKSQATFRLGDSDNGYSKDGSNIFFQGQYTTNRWLTGGTFYCYGSVFRWDNNSLSANSGTMYFYDSIIHGPGTSVVDGFLTDAAVNKYFRNVYINNIQKIFIQSSFAENEEVHICTAAISYHLYGGSLDATIDQGRLTNVTTDVSVGGAGGNNVLKMKDLKSPINTKSITNAETSSIIEQYTCNIKIVDKDGNNISGATVTCDISESSNYDTEEFNVSTAADGTITEQTIDAKKWVGTSETETDYSPMRLTISKTGYETLVMEGNTVDAPIDWRVELQTEKKKPVTISTIVTG